MISRCDPEEPSIPTPIPEWLVPTGSSPIAGQADSSSLPLSINPWAILDRLPLADAVLTLMLLRPTPRHLDRIFQAHRGPSFEQLLGFPDLRPADRRCPAPAPRQRTPELPAGRRAGHAPHQRRGRLRQAPAHPHVAEPRLPRGDLRPTSAHSSPRRPPPGSRPRASAA